MIDKKIGFLGGGQLGLMIAQAALDYGIKLHFLDPDYNCSASIVGDITIGDFNNYDDVINFGKKMDIISIEIENVNTQALYYLQKEGKEVYPQAEIIELIKDKSKQKQFLIENGINTSEFHIINSISEINNFEFPIVIKKAVGGYDGKGVSIIKSANEISDEFDCKCIIEKLVNIRKEISVIVNRNKNGEIKCFDPVEQLFNSKSNLVEFLISPANIEDHVKQNLLKISIDIAEKLNIIGSLTIEYFIDNDGNVLVNELAPRTHNSGHLTIENAITSQFLQNLLSITNLPLGSTQIISPAIMINIVGDENALGKVKYNGMDKILKLDGVKIHLYNKKNVKPNRKMGHISIIDSDLDNAMKKSIFITNNFKVEGL